MITAPVLETERLRLRPHVKEDFEASAAMWADDAVVARISGVPSTPAQSWARLLRYGGLWPLLGFGYWVVETKASGEFLGEVGLADFHRETTPALNGAPEAGWAFRADAQGQGFAHEAVVAMLSWADENLSHPRIVALFDPDHAASIRLAQKTGFGNATMGHFGDDAALFMERHRRT